MTMTIDDNPTPAPEPCPPLARLFASLYLASGWTPIPIQAFGKHPLVEWKPYQAAPPTFEAVKGWWATWPAANVGIVTGALSGLVVVDLDSEAAIEDFLTRWGDLTPLVTPIVRTGTGVHIYFRHPGFPVPNRVKVLPGMDIRGDGGYVVAPGSIHPSGEDYRWLELGDSFMSPTMAEALNGEPNGLATMPEWLLSLLAEPPMETDRTLAGDGPAILEGERNATLYRIARACHARGLSESAIRAAIRAENLERCQPPLSAAEIETLIEHALTQPDRPDFNGAIEGGEGQSEGTTPPHNTDPIADPLLALLRAHLHVTRLSDVIPEDVSWLWPGYIPLGKLTLLVGDPGTGKSFVTLDVAARVSSGKAWPDGTPVEAVGDVLILQAEDGIADTIRPRLDTLGAECSRVIQIDAARVGTDARAFSLDTDIAKLEPALAIGSVRLVIIDPLTAYLGSADSYKDADVRRVLTPLARLAETTRVAIVGVMHLNKKEDRAALYRTGGSVGFVAVARKALAIVKDRNDPERRILLAIKSNLPDTSPILAFRAIDGRLEWEPADDITDAEALLSPGVQTHPSTEPAKSGAAKAFLQAQLGAGPLPTVELQLAAKTNGLAWRTVERAKRDLGVLTQPRPGGGWLWSLPATDPPPEPAKSLGGVLAAEPATASPTEAGDDGGRISTPIQNGG